MIYTHLMIAMAGFLSLPSVSAGPPGSIPSKAGRINARRTRVPVPRRCRGIWMYKSDDPSQLLPVHEHAIPSDRDMIRVPLKYYASGDPVGTTAMVCSKCVGDFIRKNSSRTRKIIEIILSHKNKVSDRTVQPCDKPVEILKRVISDSALYIVYNPESKAISFPEGDDLRVPVQFRRLHEQALLGLAEEEKMERRTPPTRVVDDNEEMIKTIKSILEKGDYVRLNKLGGHAGMKNKLQELRDGKWAELEYYTGVEDYNTPTCKLFGNVDVKFTNGSTGREFISIKVAPSMIELVEEIFSPEGIDFS